MPITVSWATPMASGSSLATGLGIAPTDLAVRSDIWLLKKSSELNQLAESHIIKDNNDNY
jgi:hypothetical protein